MKVFSNLSTKVSVTSTTTSSVAWSIRVSHHCPCGSLVPELPSHKSHPPCVSIGGVAGIASNCKVQIGLELFLEICSFKSTTGDLTHAQPENSCHKKSQQHFWNMLQQKCEWKIVRFQDCMELKSGKQIKLFDLFYVESQLRLRMSIFLSIEWIWSFLR